MKLKALLISPTWPKSERMMRQLMRVSTVTEQLGLAYLASVLRQQGHAVDIFDGIAEECTADQLSRRLAGRDYDLIGMIVFTPSVKRALENLQELRRHFPKAVIGIGGPHVTAFANIQKVSELMHQFSMVDFAAFGEGEITLRELAERVKAGRNFENVSGLIWRDGATVKVNSFRPLIENLDEIPFPAIDLLPLHKYKRTPSSCKREPARSIMISRGCPYRCVFCDRSAFGQRVRRRSLENVMQEIHHLIDNFHAREIRIWDDVFTLNEKFVLEFCAAIKPLNVLWTCNARVNHLSSQMAQCMHAAGCWGLDFGIESGNDRVLKGINKNFTTADARLAFKIAKDAGLAIRAFFILGLPGEDHSSIRDTIRFSLNNKIDYATFYLPQPYPGTPLYEIALKEHALVSQDWSDFLIEGDKPTYLNANFSAAELIAFQKSAYRKFYRNLPLLFRHLKQIRNWEDIKRYASGVSVLGI